MAARGGLFCFFLVRSTHFLKFRKTIEHRPFLELAGTPKCSVPGGIIPPGSTPYGGAAGVPTAALPAATATVSTASLLVMATGAAVVPVVVAAAVAFPDGFRQLLLVRRTSRLVRCAGECSLVCCVYVHINTYKHIHYMNLSLYLYIRVSIHINK